jgi:hypothetical protein
MAIINDFMESIKERKDEKGCMFDLLVSLSAKLPCDVVKRIVDERLHSYAHYDSLSPNKYSAISDEYDELEERREAGTVTDPSTGLMWQQESAGPMFWEEALNYCEGLSLGGYNDWRLPNINELESLVDYARYGPAIDTTAFPDTMSSSYWSSTTRAYYTSSAWCVYFYYGSVNHYYYKSSSYYVRAVRGGQSGSFGDLAIKQGGRQ